MTKHEKGKGPKVPKRPTPPGYAPVDADNSPSSSRSGAAQRQPASTSGSSTRGAISQQSPSASGSGSTTCPTSGHFSATSKQKASADQASSLDSSMQQLNVNNESGQCEGDPGKIPRQCDEKLSHRNKTVRTDLGPKQSVSQSTSIDTIPHQQTGFLNAQKQSSIRKARQAQTDKRFDHHELRPEIVRVNKDLKILTNHFKVNLPAKVVLYEYSIGDFPAKASRAKCKVMILDMIEIDPELYTARNQIATDYKSKLITRHPLHGTPEDTNVHIRSIYVNDFTAGSRETPGQKALSLTFRAKHELDGLNAFTMGNDEHYEDRGAKQALNIVIAKAVADADSNEDTFQVGSNRFYFRPGWNDIEVKDNKDTDSIGLVAIRGYFSSIKPSMGNVLLNVNNVTSAFYKAQPLKGYLLTICPLEDWQSFKDAIPTDLKKQLERHLSGRRARVNFNRAGKAGQSEEIDWEGRRIKTLCEFGNFPQKQTLKLDDANSKKSVWKHLCQKYFDHCADEDKNLPTANVGRKDDGKQKYYLAGQLDVIADQIYKGTLSGEATAAVIKIAKKRPEENYRTILSEGMQCLRLSEGESQPMLGNLDITIIPKLLELPARRIDSPLISMSPDISSKPWNGFWAISSDAKFKIGPKKVQFFCGNFSTPDRDFFPVYVESFLSYHAAYNAQELELSNPNPNRTYEMIQDGSPEVVEKQLRAFHAKFSFDIAVMVFPSSDSNSRRLYASFKIAVDQLCGLKSLCINADKFFPRKFLRNCKRVSSREQARALLAEVSDKDQTRINDYIRNLSMKLNLRFGGCNHTIDSAPFRNFQKRGVMILGADVTHPGAGSVEGTPSIAAVVATIDNEFARFSGSMRLNPARQEIIEPLEDMACDLVQSWYNNNDEKMPREILYYRDGVSESQYAAIREREVRAIRSAWQSFRQSKNCWDKTAPETPNITTVVVTKRHHTRLYPKPEPKPAEADPKGKGKASSSTEKKDTFNFQTRHATKSGNCIPGTIVDHTITSPYYFDFYLLSHNVPGVSGTAKPAHYIVLENGMNFSAQEIQDLTFHLCFMYARCNSSVSYVPAAYYADRLCERGRLYLKPFLDLCNEDRQKYTKLATENEQSFNAFKREYEDVFYRGGGRDLVGAAANPWHRNLDGTMFWM